MEATADASGENVRCVLSPAPYAGRTTAYPSNVKNVKKQKKRMPAVTARMSVGRGLNVSPGTNRAVCVAGTEIETFLSARQSRAICVVETETETFLSPGQIPGGWCRQDRNRDISVGKTEPSNLCRHHRDRGVSVGTRRERMSQ